MEGHLATEKSYVPLVIAVERLSRVLKLHPKTCLRQIDFVDFVLEDETRERLQFQRRLHRQYRYDDFDDGSMLFAG